MKLAVIALALVFALGTTSFAVAAAPASKLPPTQPGLSPDEGSFLFTSADDGSQIIYFIAGNTRHSILSGDVQAELQLNALWPLYSATREQVEAFAEGAPIGSARAGLLDGPVAPANAPASAASSAAPSARSQPTSYVVRPGDSAIGIARQFGIDESALLDANGITNPNRVLIGQTLVIPGGDSPAEADDATPSADDPASTVEASTPDEAAGGYDDEASAADHASTDVASTTYVVKPGDSAIAIARRFSIDEGALLDANAISNPNRVYIGQTLTIPTSSDS